MCNMLLISAMLNASRETSIFNWICARYVQTEFVFQFITWKWMCFLITGEQMFFV